jgi:hypothetical protein
MASDCGLSEIVRFEIPDLAAAARLATRLCANCVVAVDDRNDVIVTLDGDLGFAQLLRKVEAWIAEESLCAIRYEVDDRTYVLASGEANWPAATAA